MFTCFIQFLIIICTIVHVHCKFNEYSPTRRESTDKSLNNPLLWSLMQKVVKLETTLNELRRKQETFVGFNAKMTNVKQLNPTERVVFNKIIYNRGMAYNGYTGIFRAPYNGEYFFISSFLSYAHRGTTHLQMIKNGIEISKGHSTFPGSNTGTMSAVVHLYAGDRVYVRHRTAGSEIIHGDWSYFAGFLIKRI